MAKPASIVAVVGPTAVGKTALAIQLARRFNGEIVNADSRQVYIGMDIGTAKPTAEELAAVRHHLVDIRLPSEQLSLGEYLPLARRAIEDIHGRGKLPIVCGGTGQYVWALLEGWQVPKIPPDATFRAELERRAVTEGTTALWHELYKADAQRAQSVGTHNTRRIIRALEIHHATGGKIAAEVRAAEPPYHALVLGLMVERAALYGRIDARFDAMMDAGLLDEVRGLLEVGHNTAGGPLASVGYAQLAAYLNGDLDFAEAVARAKTQTHRLVRRQYTWFKLKDHRIAWLDGTQGLPAAEAAGRVADFRSD